MSDKELLELAAKAAGYQIIGHANESGLWLHGMDDEWNPLTDDGDALRLSVRLKIEISYTPISTTATQHKLSGIHFTQSHNDDAGAATRFVIVRAAAEIGKQS